MLRITDITNGASARTYKVEGKLLDAYVDELRAICLAAEQIHLDLRAVTYVDAAGENLLRELMRQGVAIVSYSGFVAELLQVRGT